ncbi:MAG: RDD family protein [Microthrixaceae bacterium]
MNPGRPPAPPTWAPVDEPASRAGTVPPLWRRVVARLIDELILAVPRLALTLPFVTWTNPPELDLPKWALALSVVVPLLYDFAFVAIWRATPGKLLLGIAVCDSPDGGRASIQQAALRALVPSIGSALLLVMPTSEASSFLALITPVVYASVAWDPRRRGLHDKAAGTIVLYR